MDPIRVPPEMFRFTSGDRAGLYVSVLHAFGEANERLETALGIDELRGRLRAAGWSEPVTDAELTSALSELRGWGLVEVIQDLAEAYRTGRDYERGLPRYALTRRGEAAFAGVQHAMTVLAATGALQTAVLDAIHDRLGDVCRELESGTDRRLFSTLTELETHLEALRTNTKQFNGELQRLLRAEGADLATFHEVKASTVVYLQEFLTDLDHRTHTIADRIRRIEAHGVPELHERALRGAQLSPLGGGDPGAAWLAQRRQRWAGLRTWFLGGSGADGAAPPRIEQLTVVARRAIVTLLQVLDRITESRRRAGAAAADFRELARWFAVLPAQDDLHRLWSTAFGLSSARHAHLAHPDPELISTTAAWAAAPPVEVAPLLRSAGRVEPFERTGQVRDISAVKAARARRAAVERAELEAAWDMLDTDGQVRLSGFGRLDYPVFERLLDLLGRALANAPDRAGVRRATTADGRIEILLRPPRDGANAELTTPRGRFRGPDYELEINAPGLRQVRGVS